MPGPELLERHLPVLRYDSLGSFLADSPAVLTDRVSPASGEANLLKRADGSVLASAKGGRRRPRRALRLPGRGRLRLRGAGARDAPRPLRRSRLWPLGERRRWRHLPPVLVLLPL